MLYPYNGKRPSIHETAWIAPGARIIGDVTIHEGASVWFNAVLRGDNEPIIIGARSNIQDGSVLHTDPGFPIVIEEDATIGHTAIIHGCRVAAGALVGMGATILNGATIGNEALIGANALVAEGRDIPAGSLAFGAPAKIARELTAAQRADVRATAARYVEKAASYRAEIGSIEA